MPKPPNVKAVYPLINREPEIKIELPESFQNASFIHVYAF